MPERPTDPLAIALAFAIRRALERRAAEAAERRAKLTVVEQRRGGRAA